LWSRKVLLGVVVVVAVAVAVAVVASFDNWYRRGIVILKAPPLVFERLWFLLLEE
jgi:hypothetical protein